MSGVPPPPLPAAGGSTNGMLPKPPGYVDITSSTPGGALPQHLKPPPQRKPLPPSYRRPQNRGKYRNSRSRCSCGRFFCYCLLIFLILLCAVAVVGAAFYIYFQPKLPAFHFQSLKIGHFLVSVKSDGTFLHSAVNATVQVLTIRTTFHFFYVFILLLYESNFHSGLFCRYEIRMEKSSIHTTKEM